MSNDQGQRASPGQRLRQAWAAEPIPLPGVFNALVARMAEALDDGRTEEELRAVADVVSRLLISYVLTPPTTVDLDDPAEARAFADSTLRKILEA